MSLSKNAELISTAPSCFVRDTCPPSESGKSSGQTEHHSLRQVTLTAPSFLHVRSDTKILLAASNTTHTIIAKFSSL